jgi:hypothetical protein
MISEMTASKREIAEKSVGEISRAKIAEYPDRRLADRRTHKFVSVSELTPITVSSLILACRCRSVLLGL